MGREVPEPPSATRDPFWEYFEEGNPNYDGEDVRSALYEYGATYFPLKILEELRRKILLGATGDGAEATIPFWHHSRAQGLVRRKLEGEPKYRLPKKEDFPARHRPLFIPGSANGETFLVEGYVDALALAALGYAVVAVGGTHANDDQEQELKRLTAPIHILPDADEEGQKAARSWVQKLYPKALLCAPSYEKEAKDD